MIINGQLYEVKPAIEAYIKDLQAENEEQRREILRLTDALKEADKVEAFLREKERQEFVNAARFCETIAKLKAENARLEEGYQKSLGVIAADSLPTKVELYKLKMMCLNHTVCETCEYIGDFGQCGLRGKPEGWSFGGAENETD